uniref:TLDc domain-containing protein n=1 Tax=Rhizophagus irregularis (strain DAOM 181602 / DAOM 197198 / MUCL 43194) TaxID=747089 RepID=U9U0S5_RHIID
MFLNGEMHKIQNFLLILQIIQKMILTFIPFIKFYNLTSKEFLDKVFPYREILPEELFINLLKTFLSLLDPNIKPTDNSKPCITKEVNLKAIDSKIITSQHAKLISKWIDRLEITDESDESSPYEFKLLFRGSRDGFSRNKFHEICDNKSRTVTLVKVKNSNEILGGYNPIKWGSNGFWYFTKDSFIFSFNTNRIEDYILSRVMNGRKAIYNGRDCGPTFGDGDLNIWKLCEISGIQESYFYDYCWSKKNCYEKPIRKTENKFNVEEWEEKNIIINKLGLLKFMIHKNETIF